MSTSDMTEVPAQAGALSVAGTAEDRLYLIDILTGRGNSYRMFSRLFFKPLTTEEIEDLAATDYITIAQSLKEDSPEEPNLLAEGFNDMGRDLRKRHTGTRQLLSTDYTMCFDGVDVYEGQVAVPYASVFLGKEELLNQEPQHQVYRIFKSESLGLKSGVDLPEDHLSFELEFLGILSDRAAQALEQDNAQEAIRNLELSRDFIVDNILTWFDLLTERANKILKTRFYRGVLKATKGYLELDLATIEDLIEVIEHGEA